MRQSRPFISYSISESVKLASTEPPQGGDTRQQVNEAVSGDVRCSHIQLLHSGLFPLGGHYLVVLQT
ncbi:hypothetical protein E2C01_003160 [Portunus trituberculatus]|uniref:Uncharacterized protein n=1 Tax=Portunus trituberculatus TaxID=210409 RepID=A0A5B7CSS8_PORTR|nr:hypothetical protein [Portunus trituberculatus]